MTGKTEYHTINPLSGHRGIQKSYSGFLKSNGEVFYPETVQDIRTLFSIAINANRKINFRGEGYSFDLQGLHNDMLISLKRFNSITFDAEARQVTVGAGAQWEDILKATEPFGLIPAIMVSTGKTSAGGTLSANCMSRFSPVLGKEGKWIEHFTLITADSKAIQCSRSQNADLFYSAIGGFGYFGAVVEITYNLIYTGTPARVRTLVSRKNHNADLYKDLLPGDNKKQTVYSVFGISGNKIRTMTCLVEYCNEKKLSPMLPHRPYLTSRLITEFLVQLFPPVGQWFWNYAYEVYTRMQNVFIDPVDEYTFFMDGNVRAKRLGKNFGMQFRAIQQTFVIPASEKNLNEFLETTLRLLRTAGTPPAMIDALHLPEDEGFLLSSTKNLSGYAVSMAFEALSPKKFTRVQAALEQLSEYCLQLDGRVHLTKNVLSKPEHIRAMYKGSLDEFLSTKKKYDPEGLFQNDFIEKIFQLNRDEGRESRAEGITGVFSRP